MDPSDFEFDCSSGSESGRIDLVLGCVKSGKTEELRRRSNVLAYADKTIFCIDRNGDCNALSEYESDAHFPDAHVVVVDRGHLFPDLAATCERWAGRSKRVIVAALAGDYMRRPYPEVTKLIPLAETVTHLNAICMQCHQIAHFSTATSPGRYMPTCRKCYRAMDTKAIAGIGDDRCLFRDGHENGQERTSQQEP